MAKTKKESAKISFARGEKWTDIKIFSNYEGLGEEAFKSLEKDEVFKVDEITPELQALIKDNKIIKK